MTKKLYVIPGHGAGDSGAVGGGKQEALLVRELAARLKAWGGSNVLRTAYKRNYYADKGISRINRVTRPTKSWKIVELHMDSGPASAKGAHIIVDSRVNVNADMKDTAAAMAKMFPGRADTIVKRDNLANPKHAYERGYEYMLIECGFISNKRDREYFIAHMDDIAKAILKANGITPRKTPMKVKCPW